MTEAPKGKGGIIHGAIGLGMGGNARWAWIGILLAAIALAILVNSRISNLKVDVGIDVAKGTKAIPKLFELRDEKLVPLEQVLQPVPRFAPKGTLRYHTAIPRRALARLVVGMGRGGAPSVQRIFIATWVPRVFFAEGRRPAYRSWRGAHERWDVMPQGTDTIALPPLARVEQGGPVTAIFVGGTAFLILGLLTVLLSITLRTCRWMMRNRVESAELAPFSLRALLSFALPAAIVWSFFLASYFPGNGSPDVNDQWMQAKGTLPLSNAHPAFHTLTIRWLTSLWDSPACAILWQIISMALVVGYAYSLALRAHVSRLVVFLAYAATVLSPRNGFMSIILWKDVPYSILCVLLAVLLAHYMLDARVRTRAAFWFALALTLALIPAFRHNGLLITVGICAILPFAFWQQRRAAIATVVGTFALLGCLRVVIQHGYEVPFGDRYFTRLNAVRLFGLLVHEDVPLARSELAYIDKTVTYKNLQRVFDWWDLDRPEDGQTLYWKRYSLDHLKNSESELLEMSSSLVIRYAGYVARYCLAATSLPFDLTRSADRDFRTISFSEIADFGHTPLTEFGSESLRAIYKASSDDRAAWLFWRTGWHLYGSVLLLAVLLTQRRDPRWLLVFSAFYLNTASLTLSLAPPHVRYQFPLALGMGFLVCLAFLPRPPRSK